MKRLISIAILITLISSCTSQPQAAKDTPLEYLRSFSVDGAEHKVILAAEPRIPGAGEAFNLTVSVFDKNNKHPPHLTYSLTITNAQGKIFADSLHDMDGGPYKKRVILASSGGYMLRLQVDFGIGSMKSEPFKGEFGFWVSK